MKSGFPALGLILLSCAAFAKAAQPVASLSCAANAGTFQMNLSYFNVGLTEPTNGTPGSPAIVPLTLHAALGSYETLFASAASGALIPTCTLATQASNGDAITITLKNVQVATVTAVASAANAAFQRAAFTKATLTYTDIVVTDAGNSADDGGSSSGYDIGKNSES